MDLNTVEAAIKFLIVAIYSRLEKAAAIAKAALVCANGGDVGKAIEIVLDVEQLNYESGNLLNAASTLNRIAED